MSATRKTLALLSTSALAAGAARGAVVYTPINITIPGNATLNLDLNQDSTADFKITGGSTKPFIDNSPSGGSCAVLSSSSNQGLPLTPAGTLIDGSYQSAQSAGYFNQETINNAAVTAGGWTAAGDNEGYVGLELTDGIGIHYGWAHFIYNATNVPPNVNATGTLRLIDAAMETQPGVGILAGQTADTSTPVVGLNPVPATGYLGGTAQLTVMAQGYPAPTFQWQAGAVGGDVYTNLPNGAGVSHGALNTLTLRNLKPANMADYVVVASNSSGSVTSSIPATLTVLPSSDYPAVLMHRYSFQDSAGSATFADSVGGSAWQGTLQGSAALTGSSLQLDGSTGCFATLPANLVSGYTALTVEFWADIGAGNPDWTRVFAFGSNDGTSKTAGVDYCPGAAGDYQNLDLLNAGVDDYANSTPGIRGTNGIHVTVIVDPASFVLCYYNGTALASKINSAAVPSMLGMSDDLNLVGASLVTVDPCLAGTIYELRVYQGVLPLQAIALNDAMGPANYLELAANPTLSAAPSGNNLVLSWPGSDYNFSVQARTNLASGSWSTLTNQPAPVGTNWQVSLPLSGAARFFRLVQ